MSQRALLALLGLVLAASLLSVACSLPSLLGRRLLPGDTIAFISPASPVVDEAGNITQYKQNLTAAMALVGLRVEFSPNSFADGPGGLAGTDEQRASDLMWAFKSRHIAGVIANRGGWGCNRIVDKLDYGVIRANPKVFMGFSDLTGCIHALYTQTGLTTFHGPMGISAWQGTLNMVYMRDVLMFPHNRPLNFTSKTHTTTIVGGKGRGKLLGGNLSVLTALLGSPYFPSLDEPYILFLEDVTEQSYRIDRMLTTLHLHGMFDKAQALIWGQCTDCPAGDGFEVIDLLKQKWAPLLHVPSFSGAMIGHIHEQFTLPIGGQVEVDADAGLITLLHPAVH